VSELPPITGDGDRLAQVFTNLIDNALDHTPRGGRVVVSAAPVDRSVHVAVSDTGPGIPAEDLSRIFERFYQVDKSRARDADNKKHSVGLGLTITREIVEAHGGVIRAESAEGQGTTFRLWLPLPRADDATVVRRRR
jgi:two-component system sensor histidine kinase ResE